LKSKEQVDLEETAKSIKSVRLQFKVSGGYLPDLIDEFPHYFRWYRKKKDVMLAWALTSPYTNIPKTRFIKMIRWYKKVSQQKIEQSVTSRIRQKRADKDRIYPLSLGRYDDFSRSLWERRGRPGGDTKKVKEILWGKDATEFDGTSKRLKVTSRTIGLYIVETKLVFIINKTVFIDRTPWAVKETKNYEQLEEMPF